MPCMEYRTLAIGLSDELFHALREAVILTISILPRFRPLVNAVSKTYTLLSSGTPFCKSDGLQTENDIKFVSFL